MGPYLNRTRPPSEQRGRSGGVGVPAGTTPTLLLHAVLMPLTTSPERWGKGSPEVSAAGLWLGTGGWGRGGGPGHTGSPVLMSARGSQCSRHTYSVPGASAPSCFWPRHSPGWRHHDINVTKARTIWHSSEVSGLHGRLSGSSSTPKKEGHSRPRVPGGKLWGHPHTSTSVVWSSLASNSEGKMKHFTGGGRRGAPSCWSRGPCSLRSSPHPRRPERSRGEQQWRHPDAGSTESMSIPEYRALGFGCCHCPTAPRRPQLPLPGQAWRPPAASPHLSTLPQSGTGWKVLIKDLLNGWTQPFNAVTVHPDSLGQFQFVLVLASPLEVALHFVPRVSRSGIKLHGRHVDSIIPTKGQRGPHLADL